MKIFFTNKSYQRSLQNERDAQEKEDYYRQSIIQLERRIYEAEITVSKLEERIVALENYKPIVIEHGKRRWKKM